MIEVRYQNCPQCEDRREKETFPTKEDLELIRGLENKEINEWYPQNPLYYPDGTPFMEKQQYESLDELFTRRNLQALAWLMEAIERVSIQRFERFFKNWVHFNSSFSN